MSQQQGPSIPLIKADMPPMEAVQDAFREILGNGRVTNFGRYLQQFEGEVSDYLGTNACCLSSATAGLIMTLQALDIPRGSRIVIPSFTFVATAQAVLYAGCTPVFVDVASDGNADLDDLARVLRTTPNVGAVILVHMYGLPVRTDEVATIVKLEEARRNQRIPVLYDGAHAFGSARNGVKVGGSGNAEIFSTSVTKVMTSVEGGIVSTHDKALVEKLRKMRNYGIFANYDAHFPGLNGKMSEFHAIVGIQNLRRLDSLLEARKQKAAFYTKQIQALTSFRVMAAPSGVLSTYKDYTIQLPPGMKAHRDTIMASLIAKGIETRAYFYPPVHEMKFFRTYGDRPLPMTEDLSRRVITLPFSSTITEADMTTVADALAQAEKSTGRSASRQEVRA
jgi:dTDP-4-amino-4,6-dideoxygalactose transaminase